ncbi:LacI family transcriptional regulator [Thermosporothrix hazakensis]|jgi:LacI family transcriptional regulator|uniref:LacI family transcriptional regulator n=2 Tax=Thermosporothrix TaxID=768650 RepID=A0A326UAG8_THEHA|nr:LacI family DNA-binding transcriptional regulator [Thermosporothrix hazakensis]PZW32812.1 LacI family transcriptional regulator [Thermosporothrix hazakensis]BBH87729.1 LacI family transcriptional regulator [Thermosporothrix sp. COM3]GCE50168.1 LacI family transcriptional regulator [Thermosporothrix hazakensis]
MAQLTIEDIARLAGVSRSTVSRVLNNHPNVRSGVREHVLNIINENGYTPQAAARHLVTQRTRIIGVVFPRSDSFMLANPIFASIGQGIGQVCAQRGYMAMLSLSLRDMDQQMMLNMLRSRHFDGIVLITSAQHDHIPGFLKQAEIPYTRIGYDPSQDDPYYVAIDEVEGAYKAVKHLISLGHRRIAMITGPSWESVSPARHRGYQNALAEAGIPYDPELVREGDWLHTSGYDATLQFLCMKEVPTALFCSSDMMAAGALQALYEQGIKVPQEMAVVGFDDVPQTRIIIPPLTTIRQPTVEMGRIATEMLIDQLEGKKCEQSHVILPTTLVVRQSCGALLQQRRKAHES